MMDKEKYGGYKITILRKIVQIASFLIIFGGIFGYAATAIILPIKTGVSNPYLIVGDAWSVLELMLTAAMVPLIAIAVITLGSLLFGRAFCGWVCPFGLINDLLGWLGKRKRFHPQLSESAWKFALFIAGLLLFIDVSIFYNELMGTSIKGYFGPFGDAPTTFVDPASTLFGLIFWYFYHNKWPSELVKYFYLPAAFYWRMFFLIIVIIGMLYTPRFYCKTLCPLGAVMGLGGKYAFLHLYINRGKCTECKLCEYACPMDVPILSFLDSGDIRHPQCILCLKCMDVCPTKAIKIKFS